MKKTATAILTLALSGSMIAGCANSGTPAATGSSSSAAPAATTDANFNSTGFPIVKQPITLSMMGDKSAAQGSWDQLHFFTEMEKMTNIKWTLDTPEDSGFQEKKNLAFASGQFPDVFFAAKLTTSEEVNYGKQGVLIPLEGLIDKYAPNLKKQLDDNPGVRKSITTMDGHIYALPAIGDPTGFGRYPRIWINQEWLDKLHLQMPKTVDDFYNVLKAFKSGDPNGNGKADEIPLTSVKLDDIRPAIEAAFGLTPSTVQKNNIDYTDDGKVFFAADSDKYKAYLTFMNKLYSEKLLDPESFTQTNQQMIAKGKQNVLGVFAYAGGFLVVGPEASKHYPELVPMTSAENSKQIWPREAAMTRGTFAITNKDKDPAATMRWVDYMYSKDGELLIGSGLKDVDWKYAADGGITAIRPQGVNSEEYRAAKITPSAGSVVPRGSITAPIFKIGQDKNAPNNYFIQTQVDKSLAPYARDVYPLVYFSDNDQKSINSLQTDINTYVSQMEAKFITGQEPLSKWDDYVNTLKKMNVDQLVKLYQTAYDHWKNSK